MSRTITISLPVADLHAAKAFCTALGFVNNARFSDDTARAIPPTTSSEVALNISCASREEVDAMNQSARENGGTADINPVQDHGFMYGRDFADLDGHIWGAMWMDLSALPSA